MRNKVCVNCGCDNLIADRSLGGRIICMRCGSSNIRTKGIFSSINKNIIYVWLIIFTILVILIF